MKPTKTIKNRNWAAKALLDRKGPYRASVVPRKHLDAKRTRKIWRKNLKGYYAWDDRPRHPHRVPLGVHQSPRGASGCRGGALRVPLGHATRHGCRQGLDWQALH